MHTAGARPGGRQVALPGPCLCRRATRALGAPEVPPNLPLSHPGQPLQAWPPLCLVTDRGLVSGFPGGRGLHPPFTGNVRNSCPLWTSSELKLIFLLKFNDYSPVQGVTSTLFHVCTTVVTPALGFLTEMSLSQGHPALVALETVPEPHHLLRHLKLMPPGVCPRPTEPLPQPSRDSTLSTIVKVHPPGEERAPVIRPGTCVRFLPHPSLR